MVPRDVTEIKSSMNLQQKKAADVSFSALFTGTHLPFKHVDSALNCCL